MGGSIFGDNLCPGDMTRKGAHKCPQQWIYKIGEYCSVEDGTYTYSETQTFKQSVKLSGKYKGVGLELGAEFSISKTSSYTLKFDGGEYGCGQCGKIWGRIVACEQEWSNHGQAYEYYDTWCYSRVGAYRCRQIRATDKCGVYDPGYTHCTDTRAEATYCDQTPVY